MSKKWHECQKKLLILLNFDYNSRYKVCVAIKLCEDSLPHEGCVDPMQIAIVDDEPEAIRSIEDPVSAIAAEQGLPLTIQEFGSGEDFVEAFAPSSFDIVFLDIYIGTLSGLDLARHIDSVRG